MAHRNGILVAVLGLTLAAACDQSSDVGPVNPPAPSEVTCADAPQLRQRALDARVQRVETTSDQGKIVAGSRAGFYTSLAVVADLKCTVTSAEGDAALTLALTAARNAEGAGSFYETAVLWTEAGVAASDAVSEFVAELQRRE